MLVHVSKSARCLTIASCFAGINGCASDGGASELAAMGMLVGGAATGDSSLAVAGVVGYVGVMIVAPILADGSEPEITPTYPSTAVAASTATGSSVPAPLAVQTPVAIKLKPESSVNYCYAYLTVGERGSTCSPVVEINDEDKTGTVFQTRLNGYVDKVKQSQPGVWGEFEYSKTTQMYGGFLYQMKPKAGLEASKQDAGLICLNSKATAEDYLKQLKKNDSSLKIVGWP